jgi:DNA-binding MarR family transcriptional regulator
MENDLVTRVRRLSQHYAYSSLQMHETVGRRAGLSGTDHKYLGFLLQKGQMTAGELSSLTGLIDRFEKKNLVKRRFAENDRRKVLVEPVTENIMALLEPLYKEFRGKSEALIASFSNEEMKVIETYFLKAIDLMNETTSMLNQQ